VQAGANSVSKRDDRLVIQERTDGELLIGFLVSRDEVVFAALVARYGETVLAVCRGVLRHRQDAEDASQATFLVLMRKAPSLREMERLGHWLSGVAYREARNVRRGQRRRREHEERYKHCQSSQPADEVAFGETQTLVDAAVQRLPEKLRAVFVLCCLNGESKAEAARKLGWKVGTVSSRLAKAREFVQRWLRRRGIIP
jgi:RNA polymerase sigma factor (sigma-70 family)